MASPAALAIPEPLPAERFFRSALFFLILTSILCVATTGKLDLVWSFLAPVAVLYKGHRLLRGYPAEISHRLATWLVIGYLAFFPVDVLVFSRMFTANSPNPPLYAALISAVHFLLFVTLVRFYSATTDRDALFLTMLSFSAILASAVLTVDTTFLILFFVYLLFATATFSGMELRRGARGAVVPPAATQPERERRLARALSLATVFVAIGAMAVGSVLFFFFPRVGAGYMGRTSMNPSLMSGFSDVVELGQIGEIKKNSAVVMRVETGRAIPDERLRWRGIALAKFDGRRWITAEKGGEPIAPGGDGWMVVGDPLPREATPGRFIEYTVLLEPVATDAIFVPGEPMRLRGNFTGEVGNSSGPRRSYLLRDSTGSIFNPFHNYASIRYSGISRLPAVNAAALRATGQDYSADVVAKYLQLPPKLDPRIAALAREITAQAATPYDKSLAIETYLRTRFTYTLNLQGRPEDDPLPHFLFETKAGHCEYFASSMAVMLRTLGIPSRDVNGFLPGEFNDLGGDYVVRASDAHSWVEVFFPGRGWIVFDPTPPAPAAARGVFSRFNDYLDWLELTWNEWVINYDFAHQVALSQNLQRGSRSWNDAIRGELERLRRRGLRVVQGWQFRHEWLGFLIPVALVVFLMSLRFGWLERAIRSLRLALRMRTGSAAAQIQFASVLYGELLRLLGRYGFRRGETQTPLEFAAAVNEPAVAPAVREFTQLYAHARFGGANIDAPRFRALLAQIRVGLRSR
jgi:transglutaminase-like putative cysteine protease